MTDCKLQPKVYKKIFFCPLGHDIMWYRGLEYKDCPLVSSHRDMTECKDCKLQADKQWEKNKETWEDKPVKKKKKQYKNRKKKQGAER